MEDAQDPPARLVTVIDVSCNNKNRIRSAARIVDQKSTIEGLSPSIYGNDGTRASERDRSRQLVSQDDIRSAGTGMEK